MATERDNPRSQMVTWAVKHSIAKKKHIEAVLDDARKSMADYKATSLGVPFSEAEQWLKQGAKKDEMPAVRDMRKNYIF